MRRFLSKLVYDVLTFLVRALGHTLARVELVGRERIPTGGPVILICNHAHIVDPPLVGSFSPRPVHVMAKRELFEVPLIGWIFWAVGAFPVRRFSGDLGALRVARNYLREQRRCADVPGGHAQPRARAQTGVAWSRDGCAADQRPGRPGRHRLAATRSAGDHCRSAGSSAAARTIRIEYGEPFALRRGPRQRRRAPWPPTDRIMREVAALLPEEYRGAYSDATAGTIVVARAAPDQRDQFEEERRDSRE